MNTTNRNYESSQEKLPVSEAHPWLQKHYQEKRERTIHLVKATVDQLVKEKQTVTIEAICHKSAQIDEEGRGVKKSAVLENQEAHAYYRAHSASYRAAAARNRTSEISLPSDDQTGDCRAPAHCRASVCRTGRAASQAPVCLGRIGTTIDFKQKVGLTSQMESREPHRGRDPFFQE